MEIFGKRLKELRQEKEWSMAKLATKLKVSATTLSNWEKNLAEPTAPNIVAVAKYFGVSADYLLGLEDYWKKTE